VSLLFILYTTGRCNLRCLYCGGSFDPKIVPWSVRYQVKVLEEVFRDGDSIAFYGGEPLLNTGFIKEVLEAFSPKHCAIQTNGLFLGRLSRQMLERIDTILVSIDGIRDVTDLYRGKGVYDAVLNRVRRLRCGGYEGDIVARMTVTGDSDIYRDTKHLLNLKLFDHIHWQLSMIWVPRTFWRDLWGWIDGSYKPGLARLFDEWVKELRSGVVQGIAPFQGVLRRILYGGPAPPCGSGVNSFTILPDGRIISCPIAVSEEWGEVGRLGEVSRRDLENRRPIVLEPCRSCGYLRVCGTRCLYAHLERLWGEEGLRATCECTRHLIDLVQGNIELIRDAAEVGGLELSDLTYPEYNNTVEIIP